MPALTPWAPLLRRPPPDVGSAARGSGAPPGSSSAANLLTELGDLGVRLRAGSPARAPHPQQLGRRAVGDPEPHPRPVAAGPRRPPTPGPGSRSSPAARTVHRSLWAPRSTVGTAAATLRSPRRPARVAALATATAPSTTTAAASSEETPARSSGIMLCICSRICCRSASLMSPKPPPPGSPPRPPGRSPLPPAAPRWRMFGTGWFRAANVFRCRAEPERRVPAPEGRSRAGRFPT